MSEEKENQSVGDLGFKEAIIISDEISVHDEFSGSGHTRTAKSLAATIRAFSDKDAAIGLEGAYGSGKSSVIDFTRKELESDEKAIYRYKVFTFDIWAHQSESIKRGYLEELLSWAETHPDEILDENYATEFRKDIRDRTVTIQTDRSNSFHWFAFVLLFFAPLLPLIISWASPVAWNGTSSSVKLDFFGLFAKGFPSSAAAQALLIFLYGLFVIAVALAFKSPKPNSPSITRQKENKNLPFFKRLGTALKEGLQPFKTDKAQTETETQSIKEEDPSTTEFQTLFRRLVSEIQKKSKNQKSIRLVLVFDNIDRLSVSRIQNVWADIRSIFAASLPGEQPPETKVTAIIPYDHDLIERAFALDGKSGDKSKFDVGAEVVSKTFVAALRVAPPIGFDGRNYFEAKLTQATQNQLSADHLWLAYRLFHLQSLEWESPPTPRQMINYINRFVVLWNERRGDIPPDSLALYAAVSDKILREHGGVFAPGKVDPDLVIFAGVPDWEIHLAAIYFNVSVEHVVPLIMRRELETSLLGGTANAIVKLQASPHFFDALLEFISDYTENYHAADLSNYARILNGMSLIDTKRAELDEALRVLLRVNVYDNSAVKLNTVGLKFLAKRIKFCAPNKATEEVSNWVNVALSEIPDSQFVTKELVPLIEAAVSDLSQDKSSTLRKFVRQYTSKEFSAEHAVAFILATLDSTVIDASWCLPKSDGFPNHLLSALAIQPSHVASLTTSAPDWYSPALNKLIIDHLSVVLNENIQNPEGSALPLLGAIWANYRFDPENLEAIESIRSQGHFVLLFKYALTHNKLPLAIKAFFLEAVFAKSSDAPSYGDRNVGDLGSIAEAIEYYFTRTQKPDVLPDSFASDVASLIRSKSEDDIFLQLAIQSPEASVFRQIYKQAVAIGRFSTLEWPRTFKSYAKLREILGTDGLHAWLTRCVEEHGLPKSDISVAYTIDLLRDAEKSKVEVLYELADRSNKIFLEYDQNSWESLLTNQPESLDLLYERLKSELRPLKGLASNARIALLNHLSDAFEGRTELSKLDGFYDILFKALNDSSRAELPRALIQEITREPVEAENWRKFSEAMPELYTQLPFDIVPDNFIKNVLSPLLSSGGDILPNLIQGRPAVVSKAINDASKETIDLLSDDLKASFANGDEIQKAQIELIANTVGLPASIFDNLPGSENDPSKTS